MQMTNLAIKHGNHHLNDSWHNLKKSKITTKKNYFEINGLIINLKLINKQSKQFISRHILWAK